MNLSKLCILLVLLLVLLSGCKTDGSPETDSNLIHYINSLISTKVYARNSPPTGKNLEFTLKTILNPNVNSTIRGLEKNELMQDYFNLHAPNNYVYYYIGLNAKLSEKNVRRALAPIPNGFGFFPYSFV